MSRPRATRGKETESLGVEAKEERAIRDLLPIEKRFLEFDSRSDTMPTRKKAREAI
jgi:hypothetical protein